METAVANLVGDGTRVLALVGGYFADRIAGMSERYGGVVTRLTYEWGRAVDPEAVRRALKATPADVVTVVHAETSTGVLNPVEQVAALAHEHGALTIVDAVTSCGGHPLDVGRWGVGAAYSCTQKCIGAPSGVAPVTFSPAALERRVTCAELLLRPGAARGLLGAPEVPPHDLRVAPVRVARGAPDGGGRGPRGEVGAP